MVLESCYRGQGHEFKLRVLSETDTEFLCQHFEKDFDSFQDGCKPFYLRKCLIGSIYRIIDDFSECCEQLSFF